MKQIVILITLTALLALCHNSNAQNIAVTDDDGYPANSSAMLDVYSLTKGFLAPRMSTTQRNLISSPAAGLLVYDTTVGGYYYYNGSAWLNLTSGSAAGLFWNYNAPNIYMRTATDRLGLGLTSPLSKLHLYENVSVTDGTDGNLITIQNSNVSSGVMSGIRFFNGTTANTSKAGIFYQDRLSFGRGDLILANRVLGDQNNVTTDDARLTIKSEGNVIVEAGSAIGINDAIFSVQNPNGDTVFAVYPAGVRIWVDDDPVGTKAVGSRGGFAVGGFSPAKAGFTNEFLRVTPDSVRVYIDDSTTTAGQHQGGFAVASFDAVNPAENLMHLSEHNYFIGHNSGNKTQLSFDAMVTDNGLYNVFFGYHAGQENIWGANNVLIGYEAGKMNNSGSDNVYIGYKAGLSNIDGYGNIGIGYLAGEMNTSGYRNIFMGRYSGNHNIGGGDNIFLGESAGEYNQSGNDNVYIGTLAGQYGTTASRNVFIGNNAGRNETGSDRLYIDNTSANSTNALIYGEFDNDNLRVNGQLGVNTTPLYCVHSVDNSASSDAPAVYGIHTVTNNYGVGVRGDGKYMGLRGYGNTASGNAYGIYATAAGTGTGFRYGVYGSASGGATAWAGYFSGNVNVTGTLSKGGGSFKIDHPLDPEDKYLYHSFVESPDMKNIYDGVVVLDAQGEAIVSLPDWFGALNDDFRYQLTAIGGAAPNIHIADEISNNQFKIAGGISGMKVSWMVTGIRIDNFANKNRIPVEVEKADSDKGYYLHPSAFEQPEEKGIDYKNRQKTK